MNSCGCDDIEKQNAKEKEVNKGGGKNNKNTNCVDKGKKGDNVCEDGSGKAPVGSDEHNGDAVAV